MKKSSFFILLLLAFFSVFFLRKIFVVVSDNLYFAAFVMPPDESIASGIPKVEEGSVNIIGALNPRKVIRGSAFELALFVKTQQRTYGNYSIGVTLVKPDNTVKINTGEYSIKTKRDWPKSEKIQIGPFMVNVPEVTPLGTYAVEIQLLQSETSALFSKYTGTAIEVVSYNQAQGQ